MFNPCRECKQKTCKSLCFPAKDFMKHLRKSKCSIRQYQNELETIRRAIAAKNVFRDAMGAAANTKSGAGRSPIKTKTSEAPSRTPSSSSR